MTTILVVDIGGTNVKVGFTVDGNAARPRPAVSV